MPDQKKLNSICHNIVHHAASGLSYLHPHLHQACRAVNLQSIQINLMTEKPYPKALEPLKTLQLSLEVLRKRAAEILQAEKFTFDDLFALVLKFDFLDPKDDYYCVGHGLLISKEGREFRKSVDSVGTTQFPDVLLKAE